MPMSAEIQSGRARVETDYRRLSGKDRDRRAGSPTLPEKYQDRLIKRFWKRVDKTPGLGPNGTCWEWRGSLCNGYGRISVTFANKALPKNTHVIAWAHIYHREIPEGHEVCHKCNNKACVREDHLFTGTHRANMRHAQATGRMRSARPRRQPIGYCVRLSPEQGAMIRRARVARRVGLVDLAHMAQMDKSHLSMIETGKRRRCRIEKIQFLLRFLGLTESVFGLASCDVSPVWKNRREPGYLSNPPPSVYRHKELPYGEYLSIRHPAWLTNLWPPRIDLYDALMIKEELLRVNARLADVIKATGLSYATVRRILSGHNVQDGKLLTMLRYVESLKQKTV